ncbi:SufE family protein [Pseudomonas japonica]|uniref:SufE family protein n=1 Tax=Pseudomonas japonica TaxID=256466 RepID=UPI0015E2E860|nr:SufE family protein [Pseudomonas japonica]MBA1245656.1 SufE family protein [Pseudomonas japonica]MBA1291521.1 SufE family protein [Pseudomonas japonica]
MNLSPEAAEAAERFAACASWEARARLLMQEGDRLAPLAPEERTDANRVHGCESQVWLVGERHEGIWQFRAATDARLLRGLLALLLVRANGLESQALAELDLAQWFAGLGLQRQLTPSRSNGLNAVLQRIKALAA